MWVHGKWVQQTREFLGCITIEEKNICLEIEFVGVYNFCPEERKTETYPGEEAHWELDYFEPRKIYWWHHDDNATIWSPDKGSWMWILAERYIETLDSDELENLIYCDQDFSFPTKEDRYGI
jgi:hypothetical protein